MAGKKQPRLDELLTDVGGLLREAGSDIRNAVGDAGETLRTAGVQASDAIKSMRMGLWQVCPVCNGKALPSKRRCVTCDGTRIISILNGQPPKRGK